MQVIRPRELCAQLSISRTTLWRLSKSEDFPKPIPLGDRLVGYIQNEIDQYIQAKASERKSAEREVDGAQGLSAPVGTKLPQGRPNTDQNPLGNQPRNREKS
jgi:prophage regulatory protein